MNRRRRRRRHGERSQIALDSFGPLFRFARQPLLHLADWRSVAVLVVVAVDFLVAEVFVFVWLYHIRSNVQSVSNSDTLDENHGIDL